MTGKLKNHGFTLVEILAATAITGILIVVIMGFFVNTMANYAITSARGDLLREAQISLDTITQEIRLSSNAYGTNSLLDENEPSGGWVGDADTLILGTAATDSDNNVIFIDELNYTSYKNNNIYFLDGNTLYRRIIAADAPDNSKNTTCPEAASSTECPPDSVLAENVASFTVRYFDGNNDEVSPDQARSVELTLDLQASRYGRNIEASYATRTVFRNE